MSGRSLPEIFQAFNDLNVLIIGDVMLDSYIWGVQSEVMLRLVC